MDSLSQYKKIVRKINQREKEMETLRDEDFSAKSSLLKLRIKSGESLESVLPDAYALAREAAKRTVGLRAFDVQLMGAIAIHEGNVVEMKTGEGKTLTIVFPAYLNALEGKGVHVVTANDYLALRDADWMGPVYRLLGVSVGSVASTSNEFDRQVGYQSDVTYVTNNELGFDYLKDNMVYDIGARRLRGFHYAIVDEADSVLIDEAQTPLVISNNRQSAEKDKQLFQRMNKFVSELEKNVDYTVDRKHKIVTLTLEGIKKIEKLVGAENLYGNKDEDYLFFIDRLLKAHTLYKRDRDYVVESGSDGSLSVVIVDEFTGRLMPNHRYYQGIHQAIEAKEGLEIRDETETLASVTFQHFFKRYKKMSGVTGTAETAKREFKLIYGKNVVVIPTNKPVIRKDLPDMHFLRWEDKIKYLAWSVQEHYFKKRSALAGTRSVEKSHFVQAALVAENIPSNVLNAKHTAREAEVIAQAGQPQIVTVATNMAGRGTDIELDESVKEQGGLIIYGTERHNARRIDDQLIGRAGRQGDPGESRFLISADDEIVKTYFKDDYVKELKRCPNWSEGVESKKLDRVVTKAQKQMESIFFDQRILTYEFDKVLNKQRESFYWQRERILNDQSLRKETLSLLKGEISRILLGFSFDPKIGIRESDMKAIVQKVSEWVNNPWYKPVIKVNPRYEARELKMLIMQTIESFYGEVENYFSLSKVRDIEKVVSLKVLDLLWTNHLKKVEELQEAALINSISRSDFFEEFEIEMSKEYRKMLFAAPPIICKTLWGTIRKMWEKK